MTPDPIKGVTFPWSHTPFCSERANLWHVFTAGIETVQNLQNENARCHLFAEDAATAKRRHSFIKSYQEKPNRIQGEKYRFKYRSQTELHLWTILSNVRLEPRGLNTLQSALENSRIWQQFLFACTNNSEYNQWKTSHTEKNKIKTIQCQLNKSENETKTSKKWEQHEEHTNKHWKTVRLGRLETLYFPHGFLAFLLFPLWTELPFDIGLWMSRLPMVMLSFGSGSPSTYQCSKCSSSLKLCDKNLPQLTLPPYPIVNK